MMGGSQQVPLTTFRYFVDRTSYLRWLADDAGQPARRAREAAICAPIAYPRSGEAAPTHPFYCALHDGPTLLSKANTPSQPDPEQWREGAACPQCGGITRTRLAAEWFLRAIYNVRSPKIYLTEQLTPLYRTLSTRLHNVVGSEYAPTATERSMGTLRLRHYLHGANVDLRHEDVCALTFESGSLTHIGCFDVLEHVPDFLRALREFHRVLVEGGQLILTAPFRLGQEETLIRAREEGGKTVHLLPPEYHGNPTAVGGGILCYYHFGWDVLGELRRIGFRSVALLDAWGDTTAIFGDQYAIVATR